MNKSDLSPEILQMVQTLQAANAKADENSNAKADENSNLSELRKYLTEMPPIVPFSAKVGETLNFVDCQKKTLKNDKVIFQLVTADGRKPLINAFPQIGEAVLAGKDLPIKVTITEIEKNEVKGRSYKTYLVSFV